MATSIKNMVHSSGQAVVYWSHLKREALARASAPLPDVPKTLAYPLTYYYGAQLDAAAARALADYATDVSNQQSKQFLHFDRLLRATRLELPTACAAVPTEVPSSRIDEARALLAELWPEASDEFDALIEGVVWVQSPRRGGFSNARWFGALFLDEAWAENGSVLDLATWLAHEAAHQAMFIVDALTPPLEESRALLFSPFHRELRPAQGVLHAQVALYRMLSLHQRLLRHSTFRGFAVRDRDRALTVNQKLRSDFEAGFSSLEQMCFTPAGQELFDELAELRRSLC